MRMLITGSRDWQSESVIGQQMALAVRKYFDIDDARDAPSVTVVHGDCRGADKIAARFAEEVWGWKTEPHPADWANKHRAAGPIRNKEMVESGIDVCLAFINEGSRGAAGCAALAENAGIPTYRFYPEKELVVND